MNVHYEYYRVFYYVAKYKSFTGAAGALNNNQPNVTRMMKKLEDDLGCTLFVRQRYGVTLTPEGEKLYAHISIAFEHILCGEEEIARDRSLQAGIVTIATTEIALHCVLLPILKNFRRAYPGIRIRILNHATPQAIDVLKKGLADFSIVSEPYELPAGLRARNLRAIQEAPVCSRAFALANGGELANGTVLLASQLKQYPLIGIGEKTSSFTFYSSLFNKMGLSYAPDIEAATADQVLPMIKSDLGIGFVPMEFLEEENLENLLILQTKPPVPARNICILKRRETPLSIAASELERLIRNQE